MAAPTADDSPDPEEMGPVSTVSSIFNSIILGYIVLAFNKLDLFPSFVDGTTPDQLHKNHGLEPERLKTMLGAAQSMGVISSEHDVLKLTKLGRELHKNRGFFTWAIGGYSPLLESADTFLVEPKTAWWPYVRGKYVAIGSDECNQGLMQDIFDKVIDELPVTSVADLGCGNAGRLVELLNRRPELTGTGIDIDVAAIAAAEKNRDDHSLQNRLRLIREDVFTSLNGPRPEFKDVELVMSFMMLHDLFNIKELHGELFSKLKTAFPKAKYLLLADTCLDEQQRDAATMPIFTMGYELVHSLRGIELFPLSYYQDQFTASGFKLVAQHDFGVPNTYLFVLEI